MTQGGKKSYGILLVEKKDRAIGFVCPDVCIIYV